LFLEAGDEVSTDAGKQARPMLFIRCSENVTSLFVDVSPFYVSGSVPVFWRIDREKPVSGAWWAAANNGGVGPWRGGQAIRFIKSLEDRETLLFRFTPQEGHTIEAVFNIADLRAAIGPLRGACGW
jgi:type VI secretion system protein VasI